jgi:hypothetical protein
VRRSGKENLTCDNLFALLALTHVKARSKQNWGLNPNCPRPILSSLATEMPSRLSLDQWSVRFDGRRVGRIGRWFDGSSDFSFGGSVTRSVDGWWVGL